MIYNTWDMMEASNYIPIKHRLTKQEGICWRRVGTLKKRFQEEAEV